MEKNSLYAKVIAAVLMAVVLMISVIAIGVSADSSENNVSPEGEFDNQRILLPTRPPYNGPAWWGWLLIMFAAVIALYVLIWLITRVKREKDRKKQEEEFNNSTAMIDFASVNPIVNLKSEESEEEDEIPEEISEEVEEEIPEEIEEDVTVEINEEPEIVEEEETLEIEEEDLGNIPEEDSEEPSKEPEKVIEVPIVEKETESESKPEPQQEKIVSAPIIEKSSEPEIEQNSEPEPEDEDTYVGPVILTDSNAAGAENAIPVRYRSSFTSRLIQAGDEIQGYYTALKNQLLSYKGVKSRTSWNYENFAKGRIQCARINLKGKTLVINLALAPASYSASKYHFTDMSDNPKFDKLPMLLKIKSARALKYAIELIDELMKSHAIPQGNIPSVDYHMPFEPNSELAKRGLVKMILPAGVKVDENTVFLEDNSVDSIISSLKTEE